MATGALSALTGTTHEEAGLRLALAVNPAPTLGATAGTVMEVVTLARGLLALTQGEAAAEALGADLCWAVRDDIGACLGAELGDDGVVVRMA